MLEVDHFPYKDKDDLKRVDITTWQTFFHMLPFSNLYNCCFPKEEKIMNVAEEKLNIVDLLKRAKVAERNLENNGRSMLFEQKKLVFDN